MIIIIFAAIALAIIQADASDYYYHHPIAYIEPPTTEMNPGTGIAAGTVGATFGMLDFLHDLPHHPAH